MKFSIYLGAICLAVSLRAQVELPLQDMSSFKSQAGNWQIVGEVIMDRNLDIHDTKPEETSKKKKKKGSEPPKKAVTFSTGTGILLNLNDDIQKDHLITNWEHGDIMLSLEVMIPKGSNSGIYLQGRYEVQLLDSWGVKSPAYGDIGGIYRNWETEPTMMLKGVPPMTNAAKAPGTWQKFDILFRAPKFDGAGNKISNATFEYVDLNGVRIHSNVEVPLPTGGPIAKDEVAKGPLMIQGDHGPVAFRNIKYKLFEQNEIKYSDITFQAYRGQFATVNEMLAGKKAAAGATERIEINLAGDEDNYGIAFEGKFSVPSSGNYWVFAGWGGGMKLEIDGNEILSSQGMSWSGQSEKDIQLEEGSHTFKLYNFKAAGWIPPRLALAVKGENNFYKNLHSYDSYPETMNVPAPINVSTGGETKLLRAFTYFQNKEPKLSHTIAVGFPSGISYIYDLNTANIVAGWRGEFINATPMWENRGDGSFRPRGAVQWMFLNQGLAELSSMSTPFPGEKSENFISKGYALDREGSNPIFKHEYNGTTMHSKVRDGENGRYLVRELTFEGGSYENLYVKIAEGSVKQLPDGSFAVKDQTFFVNVNSGHQALTREIDGTTELLIPVDGNMITYEIIW